MTELRVPTVAVEVEIFYADEMHVVGTVFLPGLAQRHPGPTRADEWINDDTPFFPFLEPTRNGAILLNKDRVIVMTLNVEPPEPGADASVVMTRRVRVECTGRWFEGEIAIEMPEGKARVQDYLNRRERFVALYSGDKCHLLRKLHIDRVIELREE